MSGFEAVYRLCGAGFTIQNILAVGTPTFHKGDIVDLDDGQVELGTANGTHLGVVLTGTDQWQNTLGAQDVGTARRFPVIVDDDVVYSVTDALARKVGATLDLSGNSGEQGVTTSSHKDFVVVTDSNAGEATLVRINVGKHVYNTAQ